MNRQNISKKKIPDSPGVYLFRDYRGRPLYIGRATSLKSRVKSYFGEDLIVSRGPRIVDMITKASRLTWQETDSVLEAILLESQLIKRYQPYYNVDERDDKSSQYVVITAEFWPRVFLARVRDFDRAQNDGTLDYPVKKIFGPYPQSGLIKEALKILRRLFPFKDKKSLDPRHDAFYRALGRSPQEDNEKSRHRYLKTIEYLSLFFEAKKAEVRKRLEKDMQIAAKNLRFEEAGEIKKLLYALDHINDIALIKDGNNSSKQADQGVRAFRIEAYDVAHLSGTAVVGAMTASLNGEFAPSEYRKFKISRQYNDDVGSLGEIISRRLNHSEWTYPDLILVDGNEVHKARAETVLQARRISIPVVAVTKDDRHKATRLIGQPDIVAKWRKQIIALNAEAHRFAISYHRTKSRRHFLHFDL